jgi:hypothetical protein
MLLAASAGVTQAIARQVKKPVGECHTMFKMLSSYAALPGKTVSVIENGLKITKCPPGYARGIFPQRNVGSKS